MVNISPEQAPPTLMPPGLYRPVTMTEWAEPLSYSSQKAFGQKIRLFTSDFRIQMLRPAEIRPVIELGARAIQGLAQELDVGVCSESQATTVDVSGVKDPPVYSDGTRLIALELEKDETLYDERDKIRKIVKSETGLNIRSAEEFRWDIVIGNVPGRGRLTSQRLHRFLDDRVPKRVAFAPSQLNKPLVR